MTRPDDIDVTADPDDLEDRDVTLTTDPSAQDDDELDPNRGEGGSG